MSLVFLKTATIVAALGAASISLAETGTTGTQPQATTATAERVLRVAADPNNLPFSNDKQEGFENRIADVLARQMGAKLQYVWHAQRRGFFRNTLKSNRADIVLGVPDGFEMARTTKPFYHSSYVFVTRKDRDLSFESLDDPKLRDLKIGVQLIGDDGSNSPPAHALGRRGMADNVRGFTVYGDYSQPNPPARIMEAVAKGEIDVGMVWGPLAGYFADREDVPLTISPVKPFLDETLPMAYSICVAVRRGDDELYQDVQRALDAASYDIERILLEYHVPLVRAEQVPEAVPEEDDDD